MQTQKARNGSPDVPKKASPRAARPLKITGLDHDSSSPAMAMNRTPKDKSPKFPDRRSPRSPPVSEKKRPSRISELESRVSQLQEELKAAKEQLRLSETSKRQAEEEAEIAKKQLLEVSTKLNEIEIMKLEASKEESDSNCNSNKRELTEDEAEALAVVVYEIRQLKLQIEMAGLSGLGLLKHSELINSEIQLLRGDLVETIFLVENFKNQIKDCEVSEAETEALTTETLRQLENAKNTVEALKSDGTKAIENCKNTALEMEALKSRFGLIEELVNRLQVNSSNAEIGEILGKFGENRRFERSEEEDKDEVMVLRNEVEKLRTALEAVEKKREEDGLEISSRLKIQAELQSELKMEKCEMEELKARLMENERKLMSFSEENLNLRKEIEENTREEIENLKGELMDKETELQNISDENERLKMRVNEREREERDREGKVGIAMEEVEKSSRRAERVAEELKEAQASNVEMETELRKLKIQSDQWRKAAEAATAMLSDGNNNGRVSENYGGEEMEDEMVKKKNPNVLKKIGVMWKKPQKQ